jgi:Tol biopolymer transport system component
VRVALYVVVTVAAVAAATVHAAAGRPKPALATTCGPIADHQPVWSPYGRTIAFTREVDRHRVTSAVFRIDADGRRLMRISPVSYEDARYPSWSPDATHIAFAAFGLDAVLSIVVVTATGRNPVVVGSFQAEREPPDPQLAWHPSGGTLAFVHGGWIYLVRADGSDERRFVAGSHPAWSADGTRLAYITPDSRVGLVREDGSDLHTVAGRLASTPRWSPDGKRLAFAYDTGSSSTDVAVVDTSSALIRLVARDATAPFWSPGGRRLVARSASRSTARLQLYVIELNGGRVTRVTHDASLRFGADDLDAGWSGDGGTIVFTSTNLASRGATMTGSELRLVDPDGQHERRLTYHCTTGASGRRVNEINGSWLPDLVYGTAAFDSIDAGPGDDTIHVRDREHDAVRCGSGSDLVYANRGDRVSRDCELVRYAPSTARSGT